MSNGGPFGARVGVAVLAAWLAHAVTLPALLLSDVWYRPLKARPSLWMPLAAALALALVVQLALGAGLMVAAGRSVQGTRGRFRVRLAGFFVAVDALLAAGLVGALGYATRESFRRPFAVSGSSRELFLAFQRDVAEALTVAWHVRHGLGVVLLLLVLSTWKLMPEPTRRRLWMVIDAALIGLLLWVTRAAGTGPLESIAVIAGAAAVAILLGFALRDKDTVPAYLNRSIAGLVTFWRGGWDSRNRYRAQCSRGLGHWTGHHGLAVLCTAAGTGGSRQSDRCDQSHDQHHRQWYGRRDRPE